MSDRAHSYLSAKCEVRCVDNRGGHTVVARAPIAKGELIVVWSGMLVCGNELEALPASVRRYSLQVEEDQYLVSLSDCEPPDYVNHCCDPNAGLSGQIALVAMRDIDCGRGDHLRLRHERWVLLRRVHVRLRRRRLPRSCDGRRLEAS